MGLKDRVAVITGANGALGRVVTRSLAEQDARLVLASDNIEKLKKMEVDLDLSPERTLSVAADLSKPESARNVLDSTIARFGIVDILLHFVGGWVGGKPVERVTAEDVATMLRQHVWTTFYLVQEFAPHLVANGWGRVVIVSSPSASSPLPNSAPYALAKSAQEALILTLAAEFKGTGVTANILRVRTIDSKYERDREPSSRNSSWTTPDEIASAVIYLCTDDARVVNGARIPLYGSP